MKLPSTESNKTLGNELPLLDRKLVLSRDNAFSSLGKLVGARIMVCLAKGEANRYRLITRSVISSDMREQSLATTVLYISHAFEQSYDVTLPTHNAGTISLIKKIMS